MQGVAAVAVEQQVLFGEGVPNRVDKGVHKKTRVSAGRADEMPLCLFALGFSSFWLSCIHAKGVGGGAC